MKKYIPNFLTLLRVILVPIFIWFVFFASIKYHLIWGLVIFIIASITDYYDGMLARRFKVISDFGKVMDPLADKILITAALLALVVKLHYISFFMFTIIVFREIVVSILRSYYSKKNIYIAANIWGKLKTVLQMAGIIFSLGFASTLQFISNLKYYENKIVFWINVYFWIVVLVTILSGANYFFVRNKKN